MAGPNKIVVVEARFYDKIADSLYDGASRVLGAAGCTIERVAVPGVFEIPAAVNYEWSTKRYDGVVTLGCVIRGQTDHYEHICREVSRALMDLTVREMMPHGFGILTVENGDQAWERADVSRRDLGGRAATACLAMLDVMNRFPRAS